jgi:hypothetical protein
MLRTRFLRAIHDPFRVLGVGPDASIEEIRNRYRYLAKKLHPDSHESGGSKDANNTDRFKLITAAFDELKDKNKRNILRHDLYGEEGEENQWAERRRMTKEQQDVREEFNEAESRANKERNKQHMHNMYTFEALIHPRMLFGIVPVLFLAVYTIKAFVTTTPDAEMLMNEDVVDAWFNRKLGKYETPAPWDPDFRSTDVVKMPRSRVSLSAR